MPVTEQHWQREDGRPADREHLLMVLADLDSILIKATYSSRTSETAYVFRQQIFLVVYLG